MRELLSGGDDPARLVLEIAKDTSIDPRLRLEGAIALLPFVHPKLSYAEIDARTVSMKVEPERLIEELEDRFARLVPAPPAAIEPPEGGE